MKSINCASKSSRVIRKKTFTSHSNPGKQLFLNNKKKVQPKKLERLICFSCYFSFGLSGLLYILFNFVTAKKISRFVIMHTIQSMMFCVIISASIFAIKALTVFSSILLPALHTNNTIKTHILPYLNLITFCIAGIFSFNCLTKKYYILPGVKKIAKLILN